MNTPRHRRTVDVREIVTATAALLVFLVCVTVVIVNQQTVGWVNFLAMLAGLGGLIVMLALYNRRFR
ncbi:MAG: hypothetical protein PIR02_12325 [Microbacterium enclense]